MRKLRPCWRRTARGCSRGVHTTIDDHLHVHATVLLAALAAGVVGNRVSLAITHRSHEAAHRNLVLHSQVLNNGVSTLAAQPEVLRVAAGGISMAGNFDHERARALRLGGKFVKLSLGFR